jgi:LCP family protein required for cell wall assembly
MSRAMLWTGKALAALISAAVLGAVCFGWLTYRSAVDGLVTDDVITPEPGTSSVRELPREDTTILLVGMDSRTDAHGDPLPRDVLNALVAGDAEGEQNTDTMMVVHVPADPAKHAFAVSLPRDSYVDIAGGFGEHKLNSAYARGENTSGSATAGRRTLIATVQRLTGTHIDHYAEIGLYAFSEITQAVGGVPVCLNHAVHDSYSGANFDAGQQVLRGTRALKFVRQRHGLPGGDLDRVRRQQAFLAGLANRLFSSGTLANPARVSDLVDALTKSVVLDKNWDLFAFAQQVSSLTGDRIEFSTIPTIRPDLATPYDGSAVEVDPAQVRAYFHELLDGSSSRAARQAPADEAAPPAKKTGKPTVRVRPGAIEPMSSTNQEPITAAGVPCVN